MRAVSEARMQLPESWASSLIQQPESGMSYQVLTISLRDGRRFERVVCVGGLIDLGGCEAFLSNPFRSSDIVGVVVTHDRSGPPRLAE